MRKEALRAIGRLAAQAAGEAFTWIRSTGQEVAAFGPVGRTPPQVDTETGTGVSQLSGSVSLPTSFFESWQPEIGLDQVRLVWSDGEAPRLATVSEILGRSETHLVFGITLAE